MLRSHSSKRISKAAQEEGGPAKKWSEAEGKMKARRERDVTPA